MRIQIISTWPTLLANAIIANAVTTNPIMARRVASDNFLRTASTVSTESPSTSPPSPLVTTPVVDEVEHAPNDFEWAVESESIESIEIGGNGEMSDMITTDADLGICRDDEGASYLQELAVIISSVENELEMMKK